MLYYLEKHLGGAEVFEPYLRAHVQEFAGRSINTDDWKAFLYSFMEKNFGQKKVDLLNKVDWEAWLAGTGMVNISSLSFTSSLVVLPSRERECLPHFLIIFVQCHDSLQWTTSSTRRSQRHAHASARNGMTPATQTHPQDSPPKTSRTFRQLKRSSFWKKSLNWTPCPTDIWTRWTNSMN